MREELPGSWYILPENKDQMDIVNKWATEKSGRDYTKYIVSKISSYNDSGHYAPYNTSTITFEEFMKFVVIKERKLNYPIYL